LIAAADKFGSEQNFEIPGITFELARVSGFVPSGRHESAAVVNRS